MPFFVAIYQQAWPDHLTRLLAAIKSNFAASRTAAPGRQTARVFQRLNEPTTLLSVGEWDSQAAYEAHHKSSTFEQTVAETGPPPTIEYLQRLHLFERMNERAAIFACVTILAPAEQLSAVEDFLRGPAQLNMIATPGIVSRELYRGVTNRLTVRLLVVHGWRSISDLERFRRADAPQFEGTLRSWGQRWSDSPVRLPPNTRALTAPDRQFRSTGWAPVFGLCTSPYAKSPKTLTQT